MATATFIMCSCASTHSATGSFADSVIAAADSQYHQQCTEEYYRTNEACKGWRLYMKSQLERSMTQAVLVVEGFVESNKHDILDHPDGHNSYYVDYSMIRAYRCHKGEWNEELIPVSGAGNQRQDIGDGRPFTNNAKLGIGDRVLLYLGPYSTLDEWNITHVFFFSCYTAVLLNEALEQASGGDG